MDYKLEVCAFNYASCLIAERQGAHRIELCDSPADGGTTPSFGMLKYVREHIRIPLYPIIRPRGGDFLYNEEEYEIMKADIRLCKELACDGVVIGILNADGTVDKKRCGQLIEMAYPMGVTFHRAFDRVNNAFEAMETILELGCERILTSGLKPDALAGASLLKQLIDEANERIIIMPGSGVRSSNIETLANLTQASEYHTSARVLQSSEMNYLNAGLAENLYSIIADEEEIKKIIELLKKVNL